MRACLFALALLVSPAPFMAVCAIAQASAAGDPASAATAFYKVYGAQHAAGSGGGVPDATARVRYQPVLSPRLNKLLTDAAAAQGRLSAQVKNAVAPMLEGDIFTALFDGASAWKIGPCQNDGAHARCPVALSYAPPPGRKEKPAAWTDTVVLANMPGGWKVDDVVYDPNLPSGNTGRLSDVLGMVIAANP